MNRSELGQPTITPDKKEVPEAKNNTLELPILKYKKEIIECVQKNPVSIIIGETGSGKTTQMPSFILESLPAGAKIAVTQPRRLAAVSTAEYVAQSSNSKIGEKIGYWVRFDDQTSMGTELTMMTDGILLNILHDRDPLLSDYDVIVIDEAHERNINIDLLLGLTKKAQAERAQTDHPLKIIVTSATIERDKFAQYFDQAPVVEVPGRLYPVEVNYADHDIFSMNDVILEAVQVAKRIVRKKPAGDILIFMPGQKEIEYTMAKIGDALRESGLNEEELEILPLYAALAPEDQKKIFASSKKRKIIVATNIAETSVTIPGVRYVLDSGSVRQKNFNFKTGIEEMNTTHCSKASAKQRAGRAGRTGPGECYKLYSKNQEKTFLNYQKPEIQRSDLSHVVLMMKEIGLSTDEIVNFDFIDRPDSDLFSRAIEDLKYLQAIDENDNLTREGEIMADLPLAPHLGKMVIEASRQGVVEEVVTAISLFVGGKSVFIKPMSQAEVAVKAHEKYKNIESDFLTLINVWREFSQLPPEEGVKRRWARDNFLDYTTLSEASLIRKQVLGILRQNKIYISNKGEESEVKEVFREEQVGKAIAAGLIKNLFLLTTTKRFSFYSPLLNSNLNEKGWISFGSATRNPDDNKNSKFIVCSDISLSTNGNMQLSGVQKVDPKWMRELMPPEYVSRKIGESGFKYDSEKDLLESEVKYVLKKNSFTLFENREKFEVGDEVMILNYLADNYGWMREINRENERSFDRLSGLYYGMTKERLSRETNAEQILASRIREQGFTGPQALQEAYETGKINLSIGVDDLFSPEIAAKMQEKYPDHLTIEDRSYKFKHSYDDSLFSVNRFFLKTDLLLSNIADIFTIKEKVQADVYIFNFSFHIEEKGRQELVAENTELRLQFDAFNSNLKDDLLKKIDKEMISNYLYKSENQTREQSCDLVSGEIPPLPEKVMVGRVSELQHDVYLYPAYRLTSSGDGNVIYFNMEYMDDEDMALQMRESFKSKFKYYQEKAILRIENEKIVTVIGRELEDIKKSQDFIKYEEIASPRRYVNDYELSILEKSTVGYLRSDIWMDIDDFKESAEDFVDRIVNTLVLFWERYELIERGIKDNWARLQKINPNLFGGEDISELRTDNGEVIVSFYYVDGEIKYEYNSDFRYSFVELETVDYFQSEMPSVSYRLGEEKVAPRSDYLIYDDQKMLEAREAVNHYLPDIQKMLKNKKPAVEKLFLIKEEAGEELRLAGYTRQSDPQSEEIIGFYVLKNETTQALELQIRINPKYRNYIRGNTYYNEIKPEKELKKYK